jgi:hypothetical protein
MTRTEFDALLATVRAKGFTHVLTGGGPLPLDQWRPYGAFDGGNPGIEEHIGGFRWHDDSRIADYPPVGSAAERSGMPSGVWTLLP